MGRRPTIERDAVLAAAEEIVVSRGASALTIDAVAKAAGITKGGVQSCFGNKEALIGSMLERWLRHYDEQVQELIGNQPTPQRRVWAHAMITFGEDVESQERSASLLASLLQSPEHMKEIQRWYTDLFADLYESTAECSRLRLALVSVEGAFFLRYLSLMPMHDQRWQMLWGDINGLLNE